MIFHMLNCHEVTAPVCKVLNNNDCMISTPAVASNYLACTVKKFYRGTLQKVIKVICSDVKHDTQGMYNHLKQKDKMSNIHLDIHG